MNALITGASKGIGRAIALKLAEKGYNLALCARNTHELEELKAHLLALNPQQKVCIRSLDCAKQDQVLTFAQWAQQSLGFINVLVNNVGQYIPGTILDDADDDLLTQMQVNVFAAHSLCKFFGKEMRSRKMGHIVNICSIASIEPITSAGAYTVTKHALLGLTNVLREELKPSGVKVSAILPGATYTSSWEGTTIAPESFIQPEDIAEAVWTCVSLSPGASIEQVIVKPIATNFN